ncbi:MAG: DNA-directed RNA polymerase subunit alpha [Endomicrobium sp.]|jgi:DNA-directed RNA polymerase subunit alpha|nr:DNA-directed RNA polymerase subunit alpha [Endomicrobium sp.]
MKVLDLEKLRKLTLDKKTATDFYGRFTAEPFERGYGHTIGNSLRRILLSSLEGAAISSVRITGAMHEFAVLKGVKEDTAQIVLNLKKIRLKIIGNGPERLYLKVKTSGKVTAGDIEKNINVEIMNSEQEIANIDNGTTLEIEMEATKGKGYVLAEEAKAGKYPVGTIFMDSLYSPVTKVNYEVENTRVEQTLNYDRLIMEIWTDGSVAPGDALMKSAKILRNRLVIFTNEPFEDENKNIVSSSPVHEDGQPKACITEGGNAGFDTAAEAPEDENENIFVQPVNTMELPVRIVNRLKNAGINTIGDLVKIKESDLVNFDNLGKGSFEKIKDKLKELGLSLGMEFEKTDNDANGVENDKDL